MRLVIKLSRSAVTTPDPQTGDPLEAPGLKVDILSDMELRDDVTLYGITISIDGTQVGRVPLTAVSDWPVEDETENPDGT